MKNRPRASHLISRRSDEMDGCNEDEQDLSSSLKRRFVWPGELHHSFVSAVFDLGLRCATSCAVASMVSNEEQNAEALVKHLLSKYREARSIKGDCEEESPAGELECEEEKERVKKRSVEIAQRQLDIAANCENIVKSFRPRLRAKHRELCDSLRLEQDKRVAARRDQHLVMASQMNLHRKMLNIKAAVDGYEQPSPKRVRISDLHPASSVVSHEKYPRHEDSNNLSSENLAAYFDDHETKTHCGGDGEMRRNQQQNLI